MTTARDAATWPCWRCPDFKAGSEIASGGELIDVAPTVAELLGFDLPDAQGRLLGELLK